MLRIFYFLFNKTRTANGASLENHVSEFFKAWLLCFSSVSESLAFCRKAFSFYAKIILTRIVFFHLPPNKLLCYRVFFRPLVNLGKNAGDEYNPLLTFIGWENLNRNWFLFLSFTSLPWVITSIYRQDYEGQCLVNLKSPNLRKSRKLW